MYCFGVCNTPMPVVSKVLVKKKVVDSISSIAVLPVGTLLTRKSKASKSVIFICSIQDLLRNLDILNSVRFSEHKVFVFASPVRLNELSNVVNLDLLKDPAKKGFGFLLQPKINTLLLQQELKKPLAKIKPVERNSAEHLAILTESVKQGSLLTPLMTFIYTLPSSTLQNPVKQAVAKVICKGLPLSKIEALLKTSCEYEITKAAKDKLFAILESDVGTNFREAFIAYNKAKKEKGSAVLTSIAKKFDVSPYELRYLLSVLDSSAADGKVVKPTNSNPVKAKATAAKNSKATEKTAVVKKKKTVEKSKVTTKSKPVKKTKAKPKESKPKKVTRTRK
jgi:hypothetical protein